MLIPYGLGSCNHSINACQLDTRFVVAETTTPDIIASTIVHEATHARLMRCGIGYEEELRSRVEAVCLRREIAFAAKLPSGEHIGERAELCLEYYSADAHWTDTALREHQAKGTVELLRILELPDWLKRLLNYALSRRVRGKERGTQ